MKCLSVSVIAPSLLLVSTVLSPVLAWSMDEMTDNQLSAATGQDGITILIAPPPTTTVVGAAGYADSQGYTVGGETLAALTQKNGLRIGAAILHDKDGLKGIVGATALSGGALIFGDAVNFGDPTKPVAGVQMGVYASTPISVKIDASNGQVASGTGGTLPVLNINVGLPADLLIRTGDISVGVSKRTEVLNASYPGSLIPVGVSGASVANAAIGGTQGVAYKIMNSMDITFDPTTPVSFDVELGHTPKGGMITFGTLNIATISFGLSLASPNGSGVNPANLTTTAKITGLHLTGSTIDVVTNVRSAFNSNDTSITTNGGIVFASPFSIPADPGFLLADSVQLNDVTVGMTNCGTTASPLSCTSSVVASNMANAPMGSFGVTGVTVKNLRIAVSGM